MADEKLRKHEIPLDGKLITAVDPSIIGHNYQTLTNLRYYGGRIRGVGGMTKITSSVLNATYFKTRSGIHYTKDQPSESHVLVEAFNTGVTASRILQNTTAIPSAGNFSATSLYTPSGSAAGRWSVAPDGDVAYSNDEETCIWGGTEKRVSGFVSFDPADDFYYDYTDEVQNTKTDALNVAVIHTVTAGALEVADIYIGSVRPLQGFKLYIGTANTETSVMTGFYWSGAAWVAVGSLVDGTSDGTSSLAQTGSVTFDSTITTAKVKYVNETILYWYKINISDVSATTSVYYATVNAAFQEAVDIWSGDVAQVDWAEKLHSGTNDITVQVRENVYSDFDKGTFATLDSLVATTEWIIFGFFERMSGIHIHMVDGETNTTANTTATVYYWNGDDWTTVGTITDGTAKSGISFASTGVISWDPPAKSSEFRKTTNNDLELYQYRIVFDEAFDADVQIYYVTGIRAQSEISAYKFPLLSNDRLFLCCDEKHKKNEVRYSAESSSSVFNGPDSGKIYFGDEDEIVGGAWLYSQYGSSVFNVTLFFKKNETWALIGTGPDDWAKFRVSSVVGCVDPESIKVIDMPVQTAQLPNRNIVVWRGADGVYMSDGRSPMKLSEDVDDIFDKRGSTLINNDVRSRAVWDNYYGSYHWMYAKGSATTLDKEMVLDFVKPGWYEIDRTSTKKLQYAIEVKDTNGINYNYGFTDTGYMYRLEYGTDFDGQDITHTFQFGDMALQDGSVVIETKAEYFGLIAKSKTTTTSEIATTHYGDGETTGTTWNKATAKSGYRLIVPVYHKALGGNIFHSLKFSIATDDETYGFEPLYSYILYRIERDHLIDWRT